MAKQIASLKSVMGGSVMVCMALVLMLVLGCDHDTDSFDGPFLVDRFGEFELLEPLMSSRDAVDFGAGERVFFTASFNKRLNVVLEITGQESGAVKRFELFTNALTNENALWKGGTTDLPLFREELCDVRLIIPEEDSLTYELEVEVLGRREYGGVLFTDFEDDPGDNFFLGNFEFELTPETRRQDDGGSAEGEWYYFFQGTDDVVPNFFVGLLDMKSAITGQTYVPVPTTSPEDLYFNCFMRSDGGDFGIAVLQFVYDSNDSGDFEDGQDQTFQIEGDFPLTWRGWRQINHTMAEVGMNEEQVSKIVAIRALLISNLNSQPTPPIPVQYGLDYLVFTEGQPLEL